MPLQRLPDLFYEVEAAHRRIRKAAHHTPVLTSRLLDAALDPDAPRGDGPRMFFKAENLQRIGAFKFRGAYNHLVQLSAEERARGVCCHSSGNHAQAVALAAQLLGIKAYIVMPSNSPKVKLNATRAYGAEVVLCEPTLAARESTTARLIHTKGCVLIHPYNNPRVIAGAGTAALELIREHGHLDFVVAPVGGGGLLSGTSIAAKFMLPECTIVGAEPANADDAHRSFYGPEWVPSQNPKTVADGLKTSLGTVNFAIISHLVDEIVTVSEDEIVEAMQLMWERLKIVVEPSGAVPFAVVRKMVRTNPTRFRGKHIGIIISGGNVDVGRFFSAML